MTLLAPVWMFVGIAAALGVVALHFIARQRPDPMTLPTARFVPDLPARAASRAPRPTDLLLLLLRTVAVLLLGLAFSGPVLRPDRAPLVRIVMLDRSAAVASADSGAALARAMLREGDLLIAFDTIARTIAWETGSEIPVARHAPADLATAFLVALGEAREVSSRADSIEIVLISPMDSASWNAAVFPVREGWPGSIRVQRVPGSALAALPLAIDLRAGAEDPLVATVALLGASSGGDAGARLVRDVPTADDSAWVDHTGGALVHWPAAVMPAGADSAQAPTGSGAVFTRDVIAVAPWTRGPVPNGRPIAWWVDGTPAATETPLEAGCVRQVAIGVPTAGDVALGTHAQRLVRVLSSPCGDPARLGPIADSVITRLAGTEKRVAGAQLIRSGAQTSRATAWLLAAGLVLLLIESLVRRGAAREGR